MFRLNLSAETVRDLSLRIEKFDYTLEYPPYYLEWRLKPRSSYFAPTLLLLGALGTTAGVYRRQRQKPQSVLLPEQSYEAVLRGWEPFGEQEPLEFPEQRLQQQQQRKPSVAVSETKSEQGGEQGEGEGEPTMLSGDAFFRRYQYGKSEIDDRLEREFLTLFKFDVESAELGRQLFSNLCKYEEKIRQSLNLNLFVRAMLRLMFEYTYARVILPLLYNSEHHQIELNKSVLKSLRAVPNVKINADKKCSLTMMLIFFHQRIAELKARNDIDATTLLALRDGLEQLRQTLRNFSPPQNLQLQFSSNFYSQLLTSTKDLRRPLVRFIRDIDFLLETMSEQFIPLFLLQKTDMNFEQMCKHETKTRSRSYFLKQLHTQTFEEIIFKIITFSEDGDRFFIDEEFLNTLKPSASATEILQHGNKTCINTKHLAIIHQAIKTFQENQDRRRRQATFTDNDTQALNDIQNVFIEIYHRLNPQTEAFQKFLKYFYYSHS